MVAIQLRQSKPLPKITWEKLPNDFILPDEPVESNLQPLLASALGESLELAGLILESRLIASNFGLCATVGDKTIEEINLFLGGWQGKKAEVSAYWLRWWDKSGNLLLWGSELLVQERQRAEQERQRAEQAELELEQERISCQRLVEKLRKLGVNPQA